MQKLRPAQPGDDNADLGEGADDDGDDDEHANEDDYADDDPVVNDKDKCHGDYQHEYEENYSY